MDMNTFSTFVPPKPVRQVENVMDKIATHGSYNTPGRGLKLDAGKPKFDFIPFDLLGEENVVWELGAAKYTANNWRNGMPMTQPLNACLRHLFAFAMGEDDDPESGLSHLGHALCCIRMMQNTQRYFPDLDDRKKFAPAAVNSKLTG